VIEQAVARRSLLVARDARSDPKLSARASASLQKLRSGVCAPFLRGAALRMVLYIGHLDVVLPDELIDVLSAIAAETYLAFERVDAVERLIAYGREIGHRDRLASLGKLVGVLAHEIRTPL